MAFHEHEAGLFLGEWNKQVCKYLCFKQPRLFLNLWEFGIIRILFVVMIPFLNVSWNQTGLRNSLFSAKIRVQQQLYANLFQVLKQLNSALLIDHFPFVLWISWGLIIASRVHCTEHISLCINLEPGGCSVWLGPDCTLVLLLQCGHNHWIEVSLLKNAGNSGNGWEAESGRFSQWMGKKGQLVLSTTHVLWNKQWGP